MTKALLLKETFSPLQDFSLHKEITLTLTRLGILPNLKGHGAIKKSLIRRLCYNETNALSFGLSDFCEKAEIANIRNALRVASDSGKLYRLNELLGISVVDESGYFPPKQFLSVLTEYFLYR